MEIYLICCYDKKYLKMIDGLGAFNYTDIYLVGDINKLIYYKGYKIIDVKDDKIKEYVLRLNPSKSLIIFGDFDADLIFNKQVTLFVIDIPKIKHLIFTCIDNYTKEYLYVNSLKNLFKLMNHLKVYQASISIIDNNLKKTESEIIKMILNESLNEKISINSSNICDIFNVNSICNIYNMDTNVLLFKNSDITNMFISLLSILTTYKIARINTMNNIYFIDLNQITDKENLMFTIVLISKCLDKRLVEYVS